ncbi:nitroreductase [Variovorax sp. JS1663]|uniref:nitroreductase n=1 Tax=Variovorax sp. JS1663 TaxID=1851577 RepID=UPI000B3411EE|nr:nitroreductase [Variovorax sp. JS1663]OUL99576.1 hypothetical protein A8M77_25435 [Variovorax sp. JS1663]
METEEVIRPGFEDAIRTRRSIRRYLQTPVPKELVFRLLDLAARAPSNSNTQPWNVYVLTGRAKEALSAAIVDAHRHRRSEHSEEYAHDARKPLEPYQSRRRDFGARLYGRLNIEYSENPQRDAQIARNYQFFGAPVGLIFTLRRELGLGSWVDLGMFMQTLMLAARGHGLDTCAQVSFAKYHRLIKPRLAIDEAEIVVCGMALGHADPAAPENDGWMPRLSAREFARFFD